MRRYGECRYSEEAFDAGLLQNTMAILEREQRSEIAGFRQTNTGRITICYTKERDFNCYARTSVSILKESVEVPQRLDSLARLVFAAVFCQSGEPSDASLVVIVAISDFNNFSNKLLIVILGK